MKGTENLFRRFLSLVSAKVVATGIAVLSTPIIVRLLGPSGYGDYAVLLSIFSLYMIPISGTITEGVQKFVGEGRDRDGWTEAVVRFYFLIGVGVVLVGALILLVVTLAGVPGRLFGPAFDRYVLLLVPFVIVSQIRAFGTHTVLGFGFEHLSGPLSVLKKFGTVAVGIALVLAGHGVAGMLVGHVVANLLVAVLAVTIVLRQLSLRTLLSPPALPYRKLMSFNVINVGLVLLGMSLYHVDLVMLRALTDSQTTGFYKAALAMAEYLWFVPIVVQQLLLHSTSALWADDEVDAISELSSRVTRQILLLVVLLAVGLATLAPRVMRLYYGDPFVVATQPLLILLPGTIAFAAARPLKAIAQGSGQVLILLAAIGAAATVNIVMNAVLIPRYGMVGAAVATSVGYTSMLAFTLLAAHRIGFNPLADFRPGRIILTAAVTAVPVVALDYVIESNLLALAVVPPVGAFVYTVTAVATGALDPGEIRPVLDRLPDPIDDLLTRGLEYVAR
ncbi:MAG: polysaccharide biosynthesis C-terminal domain-containing protein [Halobacteriota archaeon]